MIKMEKLGKTERTILFSLTKRPLTEQQLRSIVDRKTPLYSELKNLRDKGYVIRKWEKHIYTYKITRLGLQAIKVVPEKRDLIIGLRDSLAYNMEEIGLDVKPEPSEQYEFSEQLAIKGSREDNFMEDHIAIANPEEMVISQDFIKLFSGGEDNLEVAAEMVNDELQEHIDPNKPVLYINLWGKTFTKEDWKNLKNKLTEFCWYNNCQKVIETTPETGGLTIFDEEGKRRWGFAWSTAPAFMMKEPDDYIDSDLVNSEDEYWNQHI